MKKIVFITMGLIMGCIFTRKNPYVEFEIVETGSLIHDEAYIVIKSADEFSRVWKEIHSNMIPPPSEPDVDFKKYMVICAFWGRKPTGGYSIRIENIRETKKEIRVYISRVSPGRNCMVIQMVTYPGVIVKLRRSDKKVKFIFTDVKKDCSNG